MQNASGSTLVLPTPFSSKKLDIFALFDGKHVNFELITPTLWGKNSKIIKKARKSDLQSLYIWRQQLHNKYLRGEINYTWSS